MSSLKKITEVVMLSTEKASKGLNIFLINDKKLRLQPITEDATLEEFSSSFKYWKPQHLYFLSEDKIELNDWCILLDDLGNVFSGPQQWLGNGVLNSNLRKIITTTDTSLWLHDDTVPYPKTKQLPQPSPQFIQKYVEQYNLGNIITKVMVEYEDCGTEDKGNIGNLLHGENIPYQEPFLMGHRLKVNFKDNTITITKIKDSWTREEVIQKLKAIDKHVKQYNHYFKGIDEWLKENL